MKILVVSQYFWPETFRVNELVNDLILDGHSVTVLTGEPNYPSGYFYQEYLDNKEHFSSYNGAKIIRAKIFPRKTGSLRLLLNYLSFMVTGSFKVLRTLRKENFDIVFVFQLSPITLAVPAIIQKLFCKIPLVMWVQDLWPESLKAVGAIKNDKLIALVGKFVGWVYNRCDTIFVQSKSFIPHIQKYSSSVPIHFLPNWYDGVFDGDLILQHDLYPKKNDTFDILFAGNIGEAQDFPSILSALYLLKDSNIRLIVLGVGSKFEWLKTEIKARGLESSIILLGSFPLNFMPKFYETADALLVSLSKSDIFAMTIPSKVQSYMSSGKPILAMLDGAGSDIITEAKCGLVCSSGDYHSLANNILSLSKMSNVELSDFGNNGRKFASTNFDKNLIRKILLDNFQNLIENNRC